MSNLIQNLQKFIKLPANICLAFLILLSIAASISRLSNQPDILVFVLLHLAVIEVIYFGLPWLLKYFEVNNFIKINLKHSQITALILFLIIDPLQNIFLTGLMTLLALSFRVLARYKSMPIFNPASLPLVIIAWIAYLFSLFGQTNVSNFIFPFISWWGVSFAPRFSDLNLSIAIFLTLPFGLYLAYKSRKQVLAYTSFIAFSLVVISLYLFAPNTISQPAYLILEGTFIFAILIMLLEPKTSPVNIKWQIAYGITFALSWSVLQYFYLPEPILSSIIFSNGLNQVSKRLK